MGVHSVELTPATLAPVLQEGEERRRARRGNAQLVELPEGLRAQAQHETGCGARVGGEAHASGSAGGQRCGI